MVGLCGVMWGRSGRNDADIKEGFKSWKMIDKKSPSSASPSPTPHYNMASVFRGAGTSVRDLFRWQQRTVTIDENGEEHITYEKPPPPANPITLLRAISMLGWGAYLIGFFCWVSLER